MGNSPVVVGVDGSADSKRALQWAAEYGRRFGTPVLALTVWELPHTFGYPVPLTDADIVDMETQAWVMARDAVSEALGDDASVDLRVVQGHPAQSLVAASKSASLLVVGSRGHGAIVGTLIGSVSQHCVAHAACPVVVIPRLESSAHGAETGAADAAGDRP